MVELTIQNYEESLSNKGYEVQKDQVERIINRLRGFTTVRCVDLDGRPIDPNRRGRDGGLDLIIQIEARTKGAETRIENQVLSILLENIY